jgi:hypothetical protein
MPSLYLGLIDLFCLKETKAWEYNTENTSTTVPLYMGEFPYLIYQTVASNKQADNMKRNI